MSEELSGRYAVSLRLVRDHARVMPMQFLPSGYFDKYLNTFRDFDAKFEKKEKCHYVPLESVKPFIDRLRSDGFIPKVSPVLAEAIHKGKVTEKSFTSDHYDWVLKEFDKRGLSLRKLQEEALRVMSQRKTFVLLDEMGVGKTIESLASIGDGAPTIVVSPAVVKQNWANEAKLWRPDLTPIQIKGRGNFRWPKKGEMLIINYDILPRAIRRGKLGYCVPEEYGSPEKGTFLVMDEVHKVKSTGAARSKAMKAIANTVRRMDGWTWGLTGTPLVNRPSELWNVFQVCGVAEEAFGSWNNFLRLFRGTKTGRWNNIEWQTPPLEDAITSIQRVSLCRTLEMAAPEMPPLTHNTVTIHVDKQCSKQCDKAMEALGKIGYSLDAVLDDAQFFKNQAPTWAELSTARKALAMAKLPTILKMVEEFEENEEPLVVASSMRGIIEALGEREGWKAIMGGVSQKKRDEYIEAFQRGDLPGLALTMTAGGIGITLHRANHILLGDSSWTPADNNQTIARIRRLGQKRPQFATWVVADHPLDQQVHECVQRKLRFIESSVEASQATTYQAKENELGTNVDITSHKAPKQGISQPRRGPVNDLERWVADSIRKLAAADEDLATVNNRLGFNRFDSPLGHSIHLRLEVGLTEAEWSRATALAKKYPNQVGEPPDTK